MRTLFRLLCLALLLRLHLLPLGSMSIGSSASAGPLEMAVALAIFSESRAAVVARLTCVKERASLLAISWDLVDLRSTGGQSDVDPTCKWHISIQSITSS